MYPYFMVFGKMITTYLIMSVIGAFIAGIFVCRLTRQRGMDDNDSIIVLLFSAIGVLLGGHLLYGLTNLKYIPQIFESESFSQFIQNVNTVFGGSVYYGGLICGILAAIITIKIKKLELPIFADMLAVSIPLFHSFARVGCFLGGCCYGIESEFGFTAHNNNLVPNVNDVSRFPVQLLEAVCNILIFVLLYIIYKRSLQNEFLKGKIIFFYLILYSIVRFFDEFLRGDEIRGFVFGMSTSQFISILLFSISVIWLIVLTFKFKRMKKRL